MNKMIAFIGWHVIVGIRAAIILIGAVQTVITRFISVAWVTYLKSAALARLTKLRNRRQEADRSYTMKNPYFFSGEPTPCFWLNDVAYDIHGRPRGYRGHAESAYKKALDNYSRSSGQYIPPEIHERIQAFKQGK